MEREYIVEISHTSIEKVLARNELAPHHTEYWCIPKEQDASFVANMEDVLNIYMQPYNESIPVICMDEMPVQLLGHVRDRIEARPIHYDDETREQKHGYPAKEDYEYERKGTASVFMVVEPRLALCCSSSLSKA